MKKILFLQSNPVRGDMVKAMLEGEAEICPVDGAGLSQALREGGYDCVLTELATKTIAAPARRDTIDPDATGLNECTSSSLDSLLLGRTGEELQSWVRFGEFRLVWLCCSKSIALKARALATTLVTLQPIGNKEPDRAALLALDRKITDYFQQIWYPGVFNWYSLNELLILSYNFAVFSETIRDLQELLEEELAACGVRMVYTTTF